MTDIAIPISFPSQADPAAVVTGPNVRFTVLTSRLIRMEYSHTNIFEERAGQAFWDGVHVEPGPVARPGRFHRLAARAGPAHRAEPAPRRGHLAARSAIRGDGQVDGARPGERRAGALRLYDLGRFAGELDRVSEAQLIALRNVLERE